MKRITALALALLMLVSAAALAEETISIEEKFYRQAVLESAYKGTVTVQVTGEKTAALDDMTFSLLKIIAPRLSLEIEHSYVARQQEGQAALTLLVDGQNAGKTVFLYNQTLMGLSSDVLAGTNVWYTASRDWDVKEAAQKLVQGENAWPSILGLVFAASNASQDWKDRAAPYLTPFETKLSIWLNGFATFNTGVDEDGITYTELRFKLPAQAIKAELKQMMVDFYGNAALISLLREIAPAREAAAYLDASMLDAYLKMVDGLQLEGEAEIVRRYDTKGHSLLDVVRLPFADNQLLTGLEVSVHSTEEGKEWHVTGATSTDVDFDVTCLAGEGGIYSGTMQLTVPEPEQSEFVVEDEDDPTPDRRSVAFDYNLIWEPGEESFNLATNKSERTYSASLLIRPRGEKAGPSQSLTLTASFSTGSNKRSATRLDAVLEWRDLDSDAAVTVKLDSKTVSPFAVQSLSSVTGAVRIDQIDAQGWQALLSRWQTNAQAWLTALAARLAMGVSELTVGRR